MVRKKVDNRIRVLVENGVATNHRTMFFIVGDQCRNQVVILHHMLSKSQVKARPTVLWCYKKELGFSTHRKKKMKQLQKRISSGTLDVNENDPFELFVAATNVRYCYYNETHRILGNTYGMCVLQDFEALTPNLLARTIETVEGGGIICFLLRSMKSLKQLYTMSMDVHSRYRTESHNEVVGRFNERFLLSVVTCENCLFIDDNLKVLPVSGNSLNITALPPKPAEDSLTPSQKELDSLKDSLQDTQPVGCIVNCCKTIDQGKALLKFVDAISEKTLRTTVVMTAARGRGKSAALGLAISAAVAFSYSNIFVTSPSPENLKTLFEFVFKGFDALDYQEHLDYELIQSTNPEFNKAVVRVNIFKEHRQTIQYIHPTDAAKLSQAELLVIDEAAAIPLPLVQKLIGPYLVFLSSTVNGYEGTGRSLSLKLVKQLREQSLTLNTATKQATASPLGRSLYEITLEESVRYAPADPIEDWLNNLLCLNCGSSSFSRINVGCPPPSSCDLYYVNRDTLFCYHKASEAFLQRLMSLYVASHYKNTPNDLQLLSDAPAHHIFCLLPPVSSEQGTLPDVLCVLQICLEGEISKSSVESSLALGKRAAGDLIPWTVSEQFQDHGFASLSGARVVRIATHPDYQGMGYGSRALQLLEKYYEGEITSLDETTETHFEDSNVNVISEQELGLMDEVLTPRKNLPPLLWKLCERRPEKLDYVGVSYGLTAPLLKFWSRSGFVPVYLRQTNNELTGEHSCVMVKALHTGETGNWQDAFFSDFRRRFISLLAFQFASFKPATALQVLHRKKNKRTEKSGEKVNINPMKHPLDKMELDMNFSTYDLKRLEMYSKNMADYHLVMDLIPLLARLFFLEKTTLMLSVAQKAILLGMGLQHKSVDQVSSEIDLPASQVLGLFNRTLRKITSYLNGIVESATEEQLKSSLGGAHASEDVKMLPLDQSLDIELNAAAKEVLAKQKEELSQTISSLTLKQYEIGGTDEAWRDALASGKQQNIVSVKSDKKRSMPENDQRTAKKKKKNTKKRMTIS
ncbi:RNA cytidine acetyltransferase-like [Clavelina lepadiformis]|uniref:RNA cytidine acetyltransferase-like n=1 Tax=Clavelina lepadiformis TaxID=159417 RepID=UPI0040414B5E